MVILSYFTMILSVLLLAGKVVRAVSILRP
jgi:hypothetical protein